MRSFERVLDCLGRRLSRRLQRDTIDHGQSIPSGKEALQRTLRQGDVLLVGGSSKLGTAIKYLTQSTWSHAALYVGDVLDSPARDRERHTLIEVNLGTGCKSIPFSEFASFQIRICRPVGLTDAERDTVIDFMISQICDQYDMRNIVDLARYLLPTPPVPSRWRGRMIALGSGEPTRAICLTLIAEAFDRVRYSILPRVETAADLKRGISGWPHQEILHIRHHSLYAPADFDLAPYFRIVKPTIEEAFNYKGLTWGDGP